MGTSPHSWHCHRGGGDSAGLAGDRGGCPGGPCSSSSLPPAPPGHGSGSLLPALSPLQRATKAPKMLGGHRVKRLEGGIRATTSPRTLARPSARRSQLGRSGGTGRSSMENFNPAPPSIWTRSTYPSKPAAPLTHHLHLSPSTNYRSIIERPNYKLLIDKY